MLNISVFDIAIGAEKSRFNGNFLAFRMQQRSIASKLENVVCEDDNPKKFFICARNIFV